ncbi:hypothetical protein HDU97_005438 [Phlyctochytrium planicorne]|nr:hypothetical protein HDU97_005438 [Phlyctochytrium planicorne]
MFSPIILVLELAASATLISALPPQTPFTSIIGFGDSWTDEGNVNTLTNGAWPISPPYYNGHFSNGPVWIETLTSKHKFAPLLLDFAYGGATTNSKTLIGYTGANSTIPVPSVNQQIDKAAVDAISCKGSKPIYAMWSGSNDYFFDSFAYNLNLTSTKIVSDIFLNVAKLIAAPLSAQRIIILNLPRLSIVPYFQTLDACSIDMYKLHFDKIVKDHNKALESSLQELNKTFKTRSSPVVKIVDIFYLLEEVIHNPDDFDLENVTEPCFDGETVCDDPDSYLFWDLFHFTKRGHEIIGDAVAEEIERCFL